MNKTIILILTHLCALLLGIGGMAVFQLKQPVNLEGVEDAIQEGVSGIQVKIEQSSPDLSGLEKIKKSDLHFTTIIQAENVSLTANQIDSIKQVKTFKVPSMARFVDTTNLNDTLPR